MAAAVPPSLGRQLIAPPNAKHAGARRIDRPHFAAGHCEQGADAKGPLDAIYASLDAVVATDAAQKQLNSPLNIAVGYVTAPSSSCCAENAGNPQAWLSTGPISNRSTHPILHGVLWWPPSGRWRAFPRSSSVNAAVDLIVSGTDLFTALGVAAPATARVGIAPPPLRPRAATLGSTRARIGDTSGWQHPRPRRGHFPLFPVRLI